MAAHLGHVDAINNLADMYLNGEGVAVDEQQAFQWFHIAANGGVVEAMFTLGLMYEQGLGVAQNDTLALEYYIEAANRGDVEALYRMGNIYYYGLLSQQLHYEKALYWYEKAAQRHHIDAQFDAAICI